MQTVFGKNLRTLRKNQGFLQKDLAEEFHVSTATICLWEKGTYMPEAAKLNDIANFFNTTTDKLLGMEPMKRNTPALSTDEQELLDLFRNSSPGEQTAVLTLLRRKKSDSKTEGNF